MILSIISKSGIECIFNAWVDDNVEDFKHLFGVMLGRGVMRRFCLNFCCCCGGFILDGPL